MMTSSPDVTNGDGAPDEPLTVEELATLRKMIADHDAEPRRALGFLGGLGVALFVLAGLGAVVLGLSALALGKAPAMGAERYLAVVAACGAVGVSLGPFSELMETLGGDKQVWATVAATGKVSAGLWVTVVSLVTAIG